MKYQKIKKFSINSEQNNSETITNGYDKEIRQKWSPEQKTKNYW